MKKRAFSEFQQSVPLIRPIALRLGSLYQCKTLPVHHSSYDWGMSEVLHFDQEVSVEAWLSARGRVESLVAGDPELRRLVTVVPYYEVGEDFVVRCKPPYDGGYSADRLSEWIEYREGGRPPEGCEASYAELVDVVARSFESQQDDPAGAGVLRASLSFANSDLFFDDGKWVLFEIVPPFRA